MDIVNITKEERILFNKAKALLLENSKLENVSNAGVCLHLLRKYIGDEFVRRRKPAK